MMLLQIMTFLASDAASFFESQQWSIFTVVATFCITALAKLIIKVYNMGRLSRVELVTKDEFRTLESNIRKDMRNYKEELFNSIWALCKTSIDNELKDVKDIKRVAEEVRINSEVLKTEIKNTTNKYDEIKAMAQNVQILENKVKRLEYGDSATKEVRRSDT